MRRKIYKELLVLAGRCALVGACGTGDKELLLDGVTSRKSSSDTGNR